MNNDAIYITGHQHPDTDSIASAIAYAFFKKARGIKAIPCRLGPVNNETAYLLKRFGFEEPYLLKDARKTLSEITMDSPEYITKETTVLETIRKMHTAFLITLADMVESRDQNTGDHVRKTASYVKIILDELKREGVYTEQLTEKYIGDVVSSAPLHDVGKINISDIILNKPGKLTDEEFEIMKTHTTAGGNIISSIIDKIPDSDYLLEAKNLAMYHHEKWNGKGYPAGLAGEDIPLSARVMAVADVFDALISDRCYKKGFPYDKAFSIIREERGRQFDPKIVDAFFAAEEQILEVADKFTAHEKQETSV